MREQVFWGNVANEMSCWMDEVARVVAELVPRDF
jgi:hypothetical protein